MIPASEIERVVQNIKNYKSGYLASLSAEVSNACDYAISQLKELIPSENDSSRVSGNAQTTEAKQNAEQKDSG